VRSPSVVLIPSIVKRDVALLRREERRLLSMSLATRFDEQSSEESPANLSILNASGIRKIAISATCNFVISHFVTCNFDLISKLG